MTPYKIHQLVNGNALQTFLQNEWRPTLGSWTWYILIKEPKELLLNQGSLLFNVSTKTIQTRKVFKKKHTCGLLFAKLSYTFA